MIRALWLAGLVLALTPVLAAADRYRLPVERPGAGAAMHPLVIAQCSGCHSLDYIATQPPARDRAFWAAEVQKMIATYGATIPPDQATAIIDALATPPASSPQR